MDYQEALRFIEGSEWRGMKLGLERMRSLMARLGDPQKRLRFVHVAGSNGKGSVSALLSSVLTAAGLRVGLYTSPHLERVNERLKVDGVDISDAEFAAAATAVEEAVRGMDEVPTEFETLTAMGFVYFAQRACDIVVLEVGLGGRLDATNVIDAPLVAVIMNIGLEHTEFLGDTLAQIASEKAGIIKPGCRCVLYAQTAEVEDVVRTVCVERNVPLAIAVCHAAPCGAGLQYLDPATSRCDAQDDISPSQGGTRRAGVTTGSTFSYGPYQDLHISLMGTHQVRNACVAVEVVEQLRGLGFDISEVALRQGLAGAQWPARLEVLHCDPLFVLDGAHNPQCVEVLVDALPALLGGRKAVFLTGVLADKDYAQMFAQVKPFAAEVVCATPDSARALPAQDLADYLTTQGFQAQAGESVSAAIETALDLSSCAALPIVAFGSLYMAGEVRARFAPTYRKWQRRASIRAREGLSPEERTERSRRICQHLLASPEYQSAQTIMGYQAVRAEVDLAEFHRQALRDGKTLAFPLCVDKEEMVALVPPDADTTSCAWQRGAFGIPEPVRAAAAEVAPQEVDLVVCPCAAFDERGNRLGMGAGYYDRFLAKRGAGPTVAVAFECQKASDLLPQPWDHPLQKVFTEVRTYKMGSAAAQS
jgi:dihydrofolate synthase/folylpolyglutamate synthase